VLQILIGRGDENLISNSFSSLRAGGHPAGGVLGEDKQLLLFTLTLHFGFAEMGVRGLCVFILCLVAKNEARKHTKGLCPLDSRGAARELSIFPPRGKNVCQHFSSVAKMSFAIEKARREIQRFPSYLGSLLSPFRFSKRFQPYSPIFDMAEACSPEVGHRSPAPPVLEAVPNKTESLHLPTPLSAALA
jgi:hypothetical protein